MHAPEGTKSRQCAAALQLLSRMPGALSSKSALFLFGARGTSIAPLLYMHAVDSMFSTAVDPDTLHRRLSASHLSRLAPQLTDEVPDDHAWNNALQREVVVRRLERAFVEEERAAVARKARDVPTEPSAFVAWFERLRHEGPGQGDALFPWLAEDATLEEMRWFLQQEIAGEAGFEDLVALSQLKLPTGPKLEMARNYWDEMGQGHEGGMHGPMLGLLQRELELGQTVPVWESLALGNLMTALALSRHYVYQSIGALGVIELTAPGRAELVNAGLKRLGVGGAARRYFALHATLDVRHSQAWNEQVLLPLVASDARVAPLIAEGALMRLRAGERCFERYRAKLWEASGVWQRPVSAGGD